MHGGAPLAYWMPVEDQAAEIALLRQEIRALRDELRAAELRREMRELGLPDSLLGKARVIPTFRRVDWEAP